MKTSEPKLRLRAIKPQYNRANKAIAKSDSINKGAQTTALTTTRWIQSARLMASEDIFLFARDVPTA